jgi:2-polyprenyl-6-methoxyphenol hydroxylase-like FAD-dependent oxidoreductase
LNVVGWSRSGSKSTLIKLYANFGPIVQALLDMADESSVKVWTLLDMDKIPRWSKGKLVLLGDAVHPFLPRTYEHNTCTMQKGLKRIRRANIMTEILDQGQGGGMAIEDAGSLCVLLPLGTTKEEIPERLKLYEQLRDERAHKVQELTRLTGADLTDENRKDFNSKYLTYTPLCANIRC